MYPHVWRRTILGMAVAAIIRMIVYAVRWSGWWYRMPFVLKVVGSPEGIFWLTGSRSADFGLSRDRADATIFPLRIDAQDAVEEIKREDREIPLGLSPLVYYIVDDDTGPRVEWLQMPRRDPTLLKRLRSQLDGARRLSTQPGKSGAEKNGFDERPFRGNDSLILRCGWQVVEARYVLREPEPSRRVRKVWTVLLTTAKVEHLYDWLAGLRWFFLLHWLG
jgi:hypothetical protein